MDSPLSELLWSIVKSHITKSLTFVAGALVTKGVIEEGQSSALVSGFVEIVMGGVVFLVSSGLTIWHRYRDQIKLMIAARLPNPTLTEVNDAAARNTTPLKLLALLLAVGLGGSMAMGCAMRGKPPERQVAIISLQVISGVDAVAKTSEELHASKVLTDGQYKAVVTRLREVYAQTSRLADALKAYDAVASTDAASQVTAALNALAVLVPNLVSDVTGPAGQKLAALVGEVNKLLIAIAQAVQPAPAAGGPRELQPIGGAL
jgi:hypothetical protein